MASWNTTKPRIPRRTRLTILVVVLALSFQTFHYFPGMSLVQDAWYVLMSIALIGIYLPWRRRQQGSPRSLEAYVLVVLALVPLWSAYAAQREFGQPLLYGLLAQRGFVLVAGIPLLTHQALATRSITRRDLEHAMVFLAWSTMFLYLAMFLFLDAGSYFSAYGLGFVTNDGKEAKFKFNVVFIVFGFFYYAFKGLRHQSRPDYLRCASFFFFLLLITHGRSLLLSLILSFLTLVILWTPNKTRLLSYLPKVALTAGFFWIGLFFFNHDLYVNLVDKFTSAFTVVFTGELTDDPSANARISETLLALPYIQNHWFSGNGVISNQWNGGFQNAMPGYFFPDDIGIIGVVYIYGIAGLFMFMTELKLALSFARGLPLLARQHPLLDAAKGFILFYALRFPATGFFDAHEAALFFIGLLWGWSLLSVRTPPEAIPLQKPI